MASVPSSIGGLSPNLRPLLKPAAAPKAVPRSLGSLSLQVPRTGAKAAPRKTAAPAVAVTPASLEAADAPVLAQLGQESAREADQENQISAEIQRATQAAQRQKLVTINRAQVLRKTVPIMVGLAAILGRRAGFEGVISALGGGLAGLQRGLNQRYQQNLKAYQQKSKELLAQAATLQKQYEAVQKNRDLTLTQKAKLEEDLTSQIVDLTKGQQEAQARIRAAQISTAGGVEKANIEAGARKYASDSKMRLLNRAASVAGRAHLLEQASNAKPTAAQIGAVQSTLPGTSAAEAAQIVAIHIGRAAIHGQPANADIGRTISWLRLQNLLSPTGVAGEYAKVRSEEGAALAEDQVLANGGAKGTDAGTRLVVPSSETAAQLQLQRKQSLADVRDYMKYGFGGVITPQTMRAFGADWVLDNSFPTSKYQSRFTAAQFQNLNEAVANVGVQMMVDAGLSGADIGQMRGLAAATKAALRKQMETGTLLDRNADDLSRNFATIRRTLAGAGLGAAPSVNAISRWLRVQAGSPGVVAYNAAVLGAQEELGRVLTLSTTGASTDKATEIAQKALSANQSPAQWGASIETFERITHNAVSAIRDQVDKKSRGLAFGTLAANAAGADAGSASIPAAAVEYLRAHPQLAPEFDQQYGAGSAARILGH